MGERKERERGERKKKEEKEILLYTLSARTARAAFDVHARPEQHNKIHQSTGGAAFKTHSARRQSSKKETMNRFNTLEMKNNDIRCRIHFLESSYRKRGLWSLFCGLSLFVSVWGIRAKLSE